MLKKIIPLALKAGLIKKVNKKKKKIIKKKKPMKVKSSMFKQRSIINREITNSRNFFKKDY